MKCPACRVRTSVSVNRHSDGFSGGDSPLKECVKCGCVWRIVPEAKGNRIDIISKGKEA